MKNEKELEQVESWQGKMELRLWMSTTEMQLPVAASAYVRVKGASLDLNGWLIFQATSKKV